MSVDLDLSDSPATSHAASSQTPLLAILADASGLQRIERVGLEPSGKAQGKQRKVAFNQSGPDEEEELPTISPTSIYFNSAGPTSDLAGTRAIAVTPASLSRPATPRREMSMHLEKYLESPTNPRREFTLSPRTSFPKRVEPHSSDPSLAGRASSSSPMLRPPPPVPERTNRLLFAESPCRALRGRWTRSACRNCLVGDDRQIPCSWHFSVGNALYRVHE